MPKNLKIFGSIIAATAILAGCGNDEDSNQKNETKQDEVKQNDSKEEKTTNSTKQDDNKNEDIKKIGFSKYIKNGQHVFYEINTSTLGSHLMAEDGNKKEGINLGDLDDETLNEDDSLKNIIATKDGQTREFDIDFNENDTYTFKNFSKYSGSELVDKLDNAEKKQLGSTQENTVYNDPMQILLKDNNDIKGISLNFSNEEDYDLEEEKEAIKMGYFESSVDYNTTLKPFEHNGKYYSGLAKVTDNQLDEELEVSKILITEVKDKNEQITLDDKSQFDDTHIVDYKETDNGKEEQKEEDESVDNL
ncbi:hypothetical protein [Staphylococcus cohnii]|uniref:hypothetical protein n=1 Tax=Staphylococcus cohnii TaxID=29382 RepID=UPI0011A80BA0|nr:hypothetical protein [Staphylococcus cohnii]